MISSDIISSGGIDNILKDLYIDESQLEYQRKRYITVSYTHLTLPTNSLV